MAQELLPKQMTVAAYDPFRSQLAELKEGNSKAVFDYRDPKGNKDARSHIYKLRQTKAAVERVRKAEKEESLNYGRLIDAQAKEIIAEIESMIDVHEAPIREIELEEQNRVKAHKDAIAKIAFFSSCPLPIGSSAQINLLLDELLPLKPDEKFQEFMAEAVLAFRNAIDRLNIELEKAINSEREQAELERLRKEATEREQKEREERLLREAAIKAEAEKQAAIEAEKAKAEAARIEAEQKAERDRLAAEEKQKAEIARMEREKAEAEAKQKAELERIERERIQAEQRAENAAKAEREKIRLEQEAKAAADAKREADLNHRKAINRDALADLVRVCNLSEDQAKDVISAIAKHEISHVSIKY